jgi:hypothetical protein
MNSTAKVILGLVAGAVVLCMCAAISGLILFRATGSVLGNTIHTEADRVSEVAASIASYTIPAGFKDASVTSLADFSMVAYNGEDGHSHIYLFQLPAYVHVDQAEIERQLREKSGEEGKGWVEMEVVGRQPATINGQSVELVISEGINHDSQPYRQMSGMFQGKGGQALVVYSGPVSTWDQAVVDDFIASIH